MTSQVVAEVVRAKFHELESHNETYRIDTLAALHAPSAFDEDSEDWDLSSSVGSRDSGDDMLAASPLSEHGSEEFTFVDYLANGTTATTDLPARVLRVTEHLEPHPPYEICTPTSRNLHVGDDDDYMPFVPFSDDPSFPFDDYHEHYGWLAWQIPPPGPDCESLGTGDCSHSSCTVVDMLAIESARVLLEQKGLTPDDLDRVGFFPEKTPSRPSPAFPRLVKLARSRFVTPSDRGGPV